MKISLIVATSLNGVIGIGNELPWRIPSELQYFKKATLGKPIIMGANTWLSLKKALPGRLNIVISSKLKQKELPQGVLVFKSMVEVLDFLELEKTKECVVIGGAKIYEQFLPIVDEIYLTKVDTEFEITADTVLFPDYDEIEFALKEIIISNTEKVEPKDEFTYSCYRFVRN